MQVTAVYTGRPDFDLTRLVTELVEAESVPFLSALRYTDLGLVKRTAWEQTWALQRHEDAIDARTPLQVSDPGHLTQDQGLKGRGVGDIPVPPQYGAADFRHQSYWRLRGKLDVPKERFIVYPYAEREGDPTPVIGWAGWDALEQARALAGYLVEMRETEGWSGERLAPLLAGLVELLPWLRQWHNDVDPAYGIGMGDYFAQFVDEEARALGVTVDALRAWTPPKAKSRTKQGKKKAT